MKTNRITPTRREQDPTGQAGNRRAAKAEIKRRIQRTREPILSLLDSIPVTDIITNRAIYKYDLSAERLEGIYDEIQRIIDKFLGIQRGQGKPARWFFDQYLRTAYQQGTSEAVSRISSLTDDADIQSSISLTRILKSQPYKRRIQLVFARAFEDMKGFAGKASEDLGRLLADGVAEGSSPRTIAARMRKKFDQIEGYRALRIARTEINKAFTDARIEQTEDARDRLGLEVKVMHVSALTPTTRATHAARHGKLYTPEDQQEWWNSGSNRINCLCSTVEILFLNGKPLQQDLIKKQRERGKQFFGD